jgi:putative phosphoesterase
LTRLAVLADIHGNLPALEAVEADFTAIGVDQVVVAGDLVIWAPFDAQVIEHVVERRWAVLRGNHELYLTDFGSDRARPEWSDPIQYAVLHWALPELLPRWHATVAAWPDHLSLRFAGGPPIRVVHGSPRSHFEGLFSDADLTEPLAGVEEPIVVAAHTHLPMDVRFGRWRILNPGSVGVPLDGERTASYMLLETRDGDWHATHRRVPFDAARLHAEFERRAFLARTGVIGALVLRELATARLAVVPFLNWRREVAPDEPLSPALLERFGELAPWRYCPPRYRPPSVL